MTDTPGVTRKFNPFLGRADWPFLVLILIGLGIGLFTLPNYGQTWDEPVFYKYASHAVTAYLPENWSNACYDLTGIRTG